MKVSKPKLALLSFFVALTAVSGASAQDASINGLRNRLDKTEMFTAKNMRAAVAAHRPKGKKNADSNALLRALDQGTALSAPARWVQQSAANGDELADTAGRSVALNRRTGLVRMRDARGYKAATKAKAKDTDLTARAQVVLSALGGGPDDSNYDVQTLVARRLDANSNTEVVEEIARKVVVSRRIGGIPVDGDRVVLTFTTDGDLRKVLGHWHQIDFDNSQLDTALSDTEVTDRAIKRLEREAADGVVSVTSQGNAKVRTVFVPVDVDDGQFVLVPQGRVEVPTTGPSGPITTVLDFDM